MYVVSSEGCIGDSYPIYLRVHERSAGPNKATLSTLEKPGVGYGSAFAFFTAPHVSLFAFISPTTESTTTLTEKARQNADHSGYRPSAVNAVRILKFPYYFASFFIEGKKGKNSPKSESRCATGEPNS